MGKDKFLLPVKALKVPLSVSEKTETAFDADVDSLSSGLMIRKVPPIVKPGNVVEETSNVVERLAPKSTPPQIQSDSVRASPQILEPTVSSTFHADEASEVLLTQLSHLSSLLSDVLRLLGVLMVHGEV